MKVKYVHTNIIAKDWRRLSQFYRQVFGCRPVPPERDLKGQWVDALTDINGAHITGEHLALPGYETGGPTLEIFSYDSFAEGSKAINAPGFAHIAFEVDDVSMALEQVKKAGGGQSGELVHAEYPGGAAAEFVYAKDPEGNIIELQSWKPAP